MLKEKALKNSIKRLKDVHSTKSLTELQQEYELIQKQWNLRTKIEQESEKLIQEVGMFTMREAIDSFSHVTIKHFKDKDKEDWKKD